MAANPLLMKLLEGAESRQTGKSPYTQPVLKVVK